MSRLKGKKTLEVESILEDFEKEEIRGRVDIVEIFRGFGVRLEKRGKSYIGLCPWHNDKKPSLSVDREKGLYNCFGCGESGDIFSLVEKMEGVSFKQALAYLKKRAGKRELGGSVAGISLGQVAEFYHKKLIETSSGRSYLEGRGLKDSRVYVRYKLGYADGSIEKICSRGQKQVLREKGIINSYGREHFTGCITVPLYDQAGRVVGMYGRSIEGSKHLYLPGPHQGIFNLRAARVYKRIILSESIIDALSLIELGIENTIACYGVNGFTDKHLKVLKEEVVREVIIGFDRDEAGERGSYELKQKLKGEGFKVKVIFPSSGKDWNEYLLRGGSKEEVKALIEEGGVEGGSEVKGKKVGEGVYEFVSQSIRYRVAGVKPVFVDELKVMIRAEKGESRYYDKVDLYLARSRNSYSSNLSREFGVEVSRIEKDLIGIIDYLQEQRDRSLGQVQEEEELELEEIEIGEKFLKSKDIYEQIEEDMGVLGYVGERTNKLLVYLCAVSRLLEQPLSVYIQAGSGSGKSYLLETLRKLLPEEAVRAVTSFSDQSLNYLGEEDFKHKVFMLGEAVHNEVVEAQIRQMQSENELSRLITVKDKKTGELKSKELRHKVSIAFMMSSTALYLNGENASRCLVLGVDESSKQTEKVLAKQRERKTVRGYVEEKERVPEIIKKHKAGQRLLKGEVVFNPYAPYLRFPRSMVSMRRAQKQFLGLIDASALLRQKQKEVVEREDSETGHKVRGIECDLEDYRVVRELFIKGVLRGYFTELGQGAKDLYEHIRKYCKQKALRQGIKAEEVSFIQKEIREDTGLGADTVRKYMKILVDYEYIQVISGKRHGTRYCYRLREDKGIEEIDGSIIPRAEEIEAKMKQERGGEKLGRLGKLRGS